MSINRNCELKKKSEFYTKFTWILPINLKFADTIESISANCNFHFSASCTVTLVSAPTLSSLPAAKSILGGGGGEEALNIYSENLEEGNSFAGLDLNWRIRILIQLECEVIYWI